jgi:cytochrome c oxidase cbb3-type subunit 3
METRRNPMSRAVFTFLPALALLALPLAAQEAPKRSAVWEANCSVCHGDDGRGRTEEGLKKKARDLSDPKWQASVSDGRLASSIKRGRDKMPPFGRKVSDEQVKALVAEIRALPKQGS